MNSYPYKAPSRSTLPVSQVHRKFSHHARLEDDRTREFASVSRHHTLRNIQSKATTFPIYRQLKIHRSKSEQENHILHICSSSACAFGCCRCLVLFTKKEHKPNLEFVAGINVRHYRKITGYLSETFYYV